MRFGDIIDRLNDLHKQATNERSHFYVASCVREAIDEIELLRYVLGQILNTLPASRDWLDPALEKIACKTVKKTKDLPEVHLQKRKS